MNNNNNNDNKPQGISDYVGGFRNDTHYDNNSQNTTNVYFNQGAPQNNQPLFVAQGAPIKPRSHSGKFLFILLLISLGVAAYFFSPSNDKKANENENLNSISQEEMDAYDFEIAKIIFKDFFKAEYQEMRIISAKYDTETGVFKTEYVSKVRQNAENDSIIFSTYNFVNYQIEEHIYNEQTQNTDIESSDYYDIPNSKINEIRNIALQKEYKVANNLTDKEYQELYKIFTEGDFEHLTDIITAGDFELAKYHYVKSSEKIIYDFEHVSDNDSTITLECYMGFDNYCHYVAKSTNLSTINPQGSSISVKYDENKKDFTISYSYTLRQSLITKAKEYTDKLFAI